MQNLAFMQSSLIPTVKTKMVPYFADLILITYFKTKLEVTIVFRRFDFIVSEFFETVVENGQTL